MERKPGASIAELAKQRAVGVAKGLPLTVIKQILSQAVKLGIQKGFPGIAEQSITPDDQTDSSGRQVLSEADQTLIKSGGEGAAGKIEGKSAISDIVLSDGTTIKQGTTISSSQADAIVADMSRGGGEPPKHLEKIRGGDESVIFGAGSKKDPFGGWGTYVHAPKENQIGTAAAGKQVLADVRNMVLNSFVDKVKDTVFSASTPPTAASSGCN